MGRKKDGLKKESHVLIILLMVIVTLKIFIVQHKISSISS